MNREIDRWIRKLDAYGHRYPVRTAFAMAAVAVLIVACSN